MKIQHQLRTTGGVVMSLAMLTSLAATAGAQKATVEGLVIGRNGPTMSVKTHDSPRLLVILSDSTQATEKGGFLGLDRKHPGITELIPGLEVKVEGSFDPDHKLLASKIVFSRRSLRTANQIDAGLNPVAQQVAAAQDQLRSDRKDIEANQDNIAKNTQDIDTNRQGLAANTQATATNTQGIGKANQRFTQLDQYETRDSVTVNFANGKASVSNKSKDQLNDFVKTAASMPGYMIEVQGYASSTGSLTLNQKLSSERANAVLSIIQQTGVVPLTRILAPAAMGTSNQIANNHSRKGQAENRRVTVTVLVNKGITG
ncbi:MAG: OmpA family protein [Janthinobacterium lividum]